MIQRKIAIDGLWRCLCPAFDLGLLLRLPRNPRLSSKFAGHDIPATRLQKRSYTHPRVRAVLSATKAPRDVAGNNRQRKDDPALPRLDFSKESTESLYEQLRVPSSQARVQRIVEYLVEERHERPSLRLYTALIASNADPRRGSAAVVELLLKEMRAEGFVADSDVYHTVLRILAIHPDYALRNSVLEEMRERWFTISDSGWHDIVCGLLREQQFELALDKIQHMQRENIQIQPWLYDLFIYTLCEVEEFDEALKIMKYRVFREESSISGDSWFHFLDSASRCYHYEATHYAWKKRIETQFVNPSDGMCTNILNTAARHGDCKMASGIFSILKNRPASTTDMSHWEALVEAFIKSGNIHAAFKTLTSMKRQGWKLDEGSIRSLYTHLCADPSHVGETLLTLQSLPVDSIDDVPIAAVNCLLEGSIFHGDLDKAMELYKQLPTLTLDPPTTSTYNILLRGCNAHGARKDLAMFVASQLLTHKVKPDTLTYDRLLLICINQEDYEDAFRYLAEMDEKGWAPRRGTFVAMVRKCVEVGDRRAWELMKQMEKAGLEVGTLWAWVSEVWGPEGSKKRGEGEALEKTEGVRSEEKRESAAVM